MADESKIELTMSFPEGLNPYRTTWGARPPYFAGREHETGVIKSTLHAIQGGAGPMERPPFPAIVLVGPRGIGKTVMLARAIREAGSCGINTTQIDHGLLSGPQHELVSHMFPGDKLEKIFDKMGTIKIIVEGTGFEVGLKDSQSKIRSAVPAFLSSSPLFIVLDEAHNCEPEALNLLFATVQQCLSADLPLALIIAGTPGLEPLLQRCKATYVERAEIFRMNTLTHEESKQALEIPARAEGRPIDPDALDMMLDWSDNYPYFIQLVGSRTWDFASNNDSNRISLQDVRSGLEQAEATRNQFYAKRLIELARRGLIEHAAQSVKIFRESGSGQIHILKFAECLMGMNEGMDMPGAINIADRLQEVGLIWVNVDMVEPGIPSMFDYLARNI